VYKEREKKKPAGGKSEKEVYFGRRRAEGCRRAEDGTGTDRVKRTTHGRMIENCPRSREESGEIARKTGRGRVLSARETAKKNVLKISKTPTSSGPTELGKLARTWGFAKIHSVQDWGSEKASGGGAEARPLLGKKRKGSQKWSSILGPIATSMGKRKNQEVVKKKNVGCH